MVFNSILYCQRHNNNANVQMHFGSDKALCWKEPVTRKYSVVVVYHVFMIQFSNRKVKNIFPLDQLSLGFCVLLYVIHMFVSIKLPRITTEKNKPQQLLKERHASNRFSIVT